MDSTLAALHAADTILAMGTGEGICLAAAALRLRGSEKEADLVFSQSTCRIDHADLSGLEPGRRIMIVNAQAIPGKWFHDWLCENGHRPVGTISHLALAQADMGSDTRAVELLEAASDLFGHHTRLGKMVRLATRAGGRDSSRWLYLARHLAFHPTAEPDEKIAGWIAEYEAVRASFDQIVATREDLGNGMARFVASGQTRDMAALLPSPYLHLFLRRATSTVAVLVWDGESSSDPATQAVAGFISKSPLDLRAVFKQAGVSLLVSHAPGFDHVALEDMEVAIAAIRIALAKITAS